MSKIPTGYLLGRALAQCGPGPWWEYIAIVATYRQAFEQASEMAATSGHAAWLHDRGEYLPLPNPDSPDPAG